MPGVQVAAIELPRNEWPTLISALQANVQQPPSAGVAVSTLEALGYVCEEMALIKDDVLSSDQVWWGAPRLRGGLGPGRRVVGLEPMV